MPLKLMESASVPPSYILLYKRNVLISKHQWQVSIRKWLISVFRLMSRPNF